MANEQELFGLPLVQIDFKTKGTQAILRSARGIVAMILHDGTANTMGYYKISDTSDVPDTLTARNIDLIKKCLNGTPLRILLYTIPTVASSDDDDDEEKKKDTQKGQPAAQDNTAAAGSGSDTDTDTDTDTTIKLADVLKVLHNVKWNYLCAPNSTVAEQADIASWIKSERNNKRKTFKAVLNRQAADHEGIINFCTDKIEVDTGEIDDDGNAITETYTGLEYTARIAGILAGLALDRSATYFSLTEVLSCSTYEDLEERIDKGELHIFDEIDGNGVKIARACNSLKTFTTDKGQDFRYIKIIEAVDMITDDIRDTFKKYYVGKVINDYNHKMLFIAAVLVYFSELKGNVLDRDGANNVDIDEEYQRNYAILHGEDVDEMTAMEIRKYNTGTNIVLSGSVKPVNAMEDLKITFTM